MNARAQRICIWCFPVFTVVYLAAFVFMAKFLPPPSPHDTAAQIAHLYGQHRTLVRAGLVVMAGAPALLLPWFAVVSVQLKRIEGRSSPLTYVQMMAGALAVLEFIVPAVILQAALFRPNRSPALVQLLNDMAWLQYLGIVSTAVLQPIVIGFCILQDKRPRPIFPRWSGYFNIWVGTLISPGAVVCMFKTGPLAWRGLLAFWLIFAAYFVWLVVDTWLLFGAVEHETEEVRADGLSDGVLLGAAHGSLAAEVAVLREELSRLSSRVPTDGGVR
jgi:hypothetical protein